MPRGRLTEAHQALRADTLAQAGRHATQLAPAKASQIETLLDGADLLLRQVRDQPLGGNSQAIAAAARTALESLPKGAALHFAVSDASGLSRRCKRPDATQPRQSMRPGDQGRWSLLRPRSLKTDGCSPTTRGNQ